jgi:integrase
MFPNDPVNVAAAKAKDLAQKGLIVNGKLLGSTPGDTRITLADVVEHFKRARGKSRHYYLEGLCALEVPGANNALTKLGTKPIDDVTTADINHAVKLWRIRKKAQAGAQSGQVAERHLLQAARHLFNWSIGEGYASRTPFKTSQGVNLIHVKGTKGRKRRLEPGEYERILAAADPFISDFFTALVETGCRPGELRTLQWSEVKERQFLVLAAKAKDREDRRIPIEPTLRAILDRRRKGPDANDLPEDAYAFGTETGEMIKHRRIIDLWRATCRRAGVKNLQMRDQRREFASQLSESKAQIEVVRDALGHSSTTMTNTYLASGRDSVSRAYSQRTAHQRRLAMRKIK